MINDPWITATCDKCGGESEQMDLCSLAGGGWDERNIKRTLEREGWKVDGNNAYCEDCSAEMAEEDEDDDS